MSVKIERRKALVEKLKRIPARARAEIRKALASGAAEMAATARAFAPVRSGDLRNSIGFTFGAYKPENSNVRGLAATGGIGDPDLTVTVHAGDAKAFYAAFVEFGTKPHTLAAGARLKNGKANRKARQGNGPLHPGAKPSPFFFPSYRLLKPRIKGRISRATTKAAKAEATGK